MSEARPSDDKEGSVDPVNTELNIEQVPIYKLDKWRFHGLIGLVILNVVGGMNWPWFGSISVQAARDFKISVSQVNWLGNIVNLIFLPCSIAMPFLCNRYGIRTCCFYGAGCFVVAAWVRFAGTAESLSPGAAYALLLLGQAFSGIAQPLFQILGPKFSEAWFDFNGRTTATMLISIANPVGTALGEIIPSVSGGTRQSVLILGIISTAAFPAAFLIYSGPPSPPTYSGGLPPPPPLSTIRSLLNIPRPGDKKLPLREKLDFMILCFAFGTLVAATNAFSLLTTQIFGPYGYSNLEAALFTAVVILAGLVSAFVTAPLFDRVLARHMTTTVKITTPLLSLCWLSLVWVVRPNNTGGIFAVTTLIGIFSLMLMPLALELACEISQDAETSAAIMWFFAYLLGVVFILVSGALAAGPDASPPFNMERASIFMGVVTCVAAFSVASGFRGLEDTRRALDAAKQREEIGPRQQIQKEF